MKFKMNEYHSESDKIHLGIGVTKSTKTSGNRLLEKLQEFICWKNAVVVSWEARKYLHISEKVVKVGSKVVSTMSDG